MNKIKQAVLLAGGESSRFRPISACRHKAEVSLLGKTLLDRTIESLLNCGLKELIVIHAPGRKPLVKKRKDLSLKFVVQPKAKGMGNALLSAEGVLGDVFVVLHAYHCDCDLFLPSMIEKSSGKNAVLLLSRPARGKIGIAEYLNGRVQSVRETPYQGGENCHSIAGIYILTEKYIKTLKRQQDTQYNFEAALDEFVKADNVGAHLIDKKVLTLKYPWDVFGVKDYLFKKSGQKDRAETSIHSSAEIDKTAVLEGQVIVAEAAKIGSFAVIKGPAYIGRNVFVGDFAFIRDGSVLEEESVIGAKSEIKNSIILEKSHVHGYIADSVVGRGVRIGHGAITANRRFDKNNVRSKVNGEYIETGRTFLGAVVGDNASLGIGVRTMPGIIIGENSLVGPGTVVFGNIPPNTRCYSRSAQQKARL